MKRLFLLLTAIISCLTISAQEGMWTGPISIQGTSMPLVFHFDKDVCTLDSPLQGANGIKAEKTYTEDGKLKVTIPSIGASFEGYQVMKIITGSFMQSGQTFPLTLKPLNRPQTLKEPFPYTTEEVSFNNDTVPLHGTLTLPKGYNKNTPVLVMATGSGEQNRDEELFYHKPFAVITDAFALEGIATLRYDDRYFGVKTIDGSKFTTNDFKNDALAAITLLRKRFRHVGMIGHSEGGIMALMLAEEGKVDFIISLAGVAVPMKQVSLEQNSRALDRSNLTEEEKATFINTLSDAYDAAIKGEDVTHKKLPHTFPADYQQSFYVAMRMISTPYYRYLISIDTGKDLNNITCPVLALNGTLDTQVNCEENLSALEKGLTNCQHKIVPFQGLNHLFQHCTTGDVSEYISIEETMSPEVLKVMTDWLKQLKF